MNKIDFLLQLHIKIYYSTMNYTIVKNKFQPKIKFPITENQFWNNVEIGKYDDYICSNHVLIANIVFTKIEKNLQTEDSICKAKDYLSKENVEHLNMKLVDIEKSCLKNM